MVKTPQCTCPKAQTLFTLLGKKWVIFIMQAVGDGNHSFKHIREAIGNPNTKILTDRLDELTQSGILIRTVGGETPGAVRYTLSPLGTDLAKRLVEVSHWWGEAVR